MLKALAAAVLMVVSVLAAALPAAAVTWTQIPSGTTQDITAIDYRSDTQAWLATANGELLTADASGAFVVRFRLPGITFNDVSFRSDGQVGFAVAADGSAYRSTDRGLSWAQVGLTPTHDGCSPSAEVSPIPRLYAIAWAGSDTAYLTGGTGGLFTHGRTVVVRVSDAAGSATSADVNYAGSACRIGNGNQPVTDVFAVPGNPNALRFVTPYFGSVYISSDGLTTIAQKTGETINEYDQAPRIAVDPDNPNRMWIVDHGNLCNSLCLSYSEASGASKVVVEVAGDRTSLRRYLFDTAFAGGTFAAVGDNGEIFASTDGTHAILARAAGALAGTNWRAVDVADAQHALVGGTGGVLVRSTDVGSGAAAPPPPPPPVKPIPTPPRTTPTPPSRAAPKPAASKPARWSTAGVVVTLWGRIPRSVRYVPIRLSARTSRRVTVVVRRLDRPRRVIARTTLTVRRGSRTVRVPFGSSTRAGRYRVSLRFSSGRRAVGRAIAFDFRIVA